MRNNIGIITQARMNSTRLPEKIFKEAKDTPLLKFHLDRLNESGYPVFVSTTENPDDIKIANYCEEQEIPYFRGSELNVLSRYYHCAKKYELDVIVRVTSDCPLIDGKLIAEAIQKYQSYNDELLYLSNCHQRTYARGFDFEIFSMSLLEESFRNAQEQRDKEHVTPYIWLNRDGKFKIEHFIDPSDNSKFRITVDTKEDYAVIKMLIEEYDAEKLRFNEIHKILKENPSIVEINQEIKQKKV